MSPLALAQSVIDARLNLVRAAIDAGRGPGRILIYADGRPDKPDEPPKSEAVLVAALAFARPCAPKAKNGEMTFSEVTEESNAPNKGRATWARISDSNANTVFDCSVSLRGKGGVIQMGTVEIAAGGRVVIDTFMLVEF